MMKSRPFSIGHCRLAFVAAAAFLACPAQSQSAPVLSMPIYAAVDAYISEPPPSYFTSLGMKWVSDCIHANLANNGLPDQQSVFADVARYTALDPQPYVCIDVEWISGTRVSVDIRSTAKATVDAYIAYFEQIIGWVRSANPCAKVGIYATLPIGDYWTANNFYAALRNRNDPWWRAHLTGFQQSYQAWQAANAYLAPLSQKVDFIIPSFHANTPYFQGTTDSWPTYAFTYIAEARKYNKPVYPSLWPENPHNYTYITDAYWQSMLQYTRDYADGMTIWNYGRFNNESWNPSVFWWQDTLNLANSLSAAGALGGHIGLVATPPDGVYPAGSAQQVSLAAAGSRSIRYSLTTTWPNSAYPTCSAGTVYTGPINVSTSEIILATACYPDGSSMNADFAYVLQ